MEQEVTAAEHVTKEIIIAYIQSLGTGANILFPKSTRDHLVTENFEATWNRILKTVMGQARESE
jgi:hypothetical protein